MGDRLVEVAEPEPGLWADDPVVMGLAKWEIEFLGLGPGETDGVVDVLDWRDRDLPSGATPFLLM